jgi:hypothetical protein
LGEQPEKKKIHRAHLRWKRTYTGDIAVLGKKISDCREDIKTGRNRRAFRGQQAGR